MCDSSLLPFKTSLIQCFRVIQGKFYTNVSFNVMSQEHDFGEDGLFMEVVRQTTQVQKLCFSERSGDRAVVEKKTANGVPGCDPLSYSISTVLKPEHSWDPGRHPSLECEWQRWDRSQEAVGG